MSKLQFEGKPPRDLLIEAIRYGERRVISKRLLYVEARKEADAVDISALVSHFSHLFSPWKEELDDADTTCATLTEQEN